MKTLRHKTALLSAADRKEVRRLVETARLGKEKAAKAPVPYSSPLLPSAEKSPK